MLSLTIGKNGCIALLGDDVSASLALFLTLTWRVHMGSRVVTSWMPALLNFDTHSRLDLAVQGSATRSAAQEFIRNVSQSRTYKNVIPGGEKE